MNFVFISPNFPERFYKFVESLNKRGVRVLGVGDTPFCNLHPSLIENITEYYYVDNLNDFNKKCAALYYFQEKYGHLDYLESNNEWWLESDAMLRERFSINTGFYPKDMEHIKAKSSMKEFFEKAGVKTMRYIVVNGKEDLYKAIEFANTVGYPIFTKPNVGVGASDSFSIKNEEELHRFFDNPLPEAYIMEEYVDGYIVSFDGICNSKSEVVFASSEHFPVPIDKLVTNQFDHFYYSVPFELPAKDINMKKFYEAGKKVVKSFGISKRAFHIEFFVLNKDMPGFAKKGEFVALECNMRTPGGNTPDLIDFANSVSIYDIYADVICYDENREEMNYQKYYAFASHRRDSIQYKHSINEILDVYKNVITMHGRYPDGVSHVMGNDYIFAKFETFEEGLEFDNFVRDKL